MVKLEDQSSGNMPDSIEWERRDMHDLPRALEADLVSNAVRPRLNMKYVTPERKIPC